MSTYERINPQGEPLHDELDLSFDDQSDDEQNPRTSTEVRRHDQRIIEEDEEAEKLLIEQRTSKRKGFFGRRNDGHERSGSEGAGRKMNEKRNSRRGNRNGSGETLYEMEEGGQRNSGESSGHSSDVDLQRLLGTQQSLQVGPSVLLITVRC